MSEESNETELPIKWEVPDMPVVFADSLVIQNTGHEFILSFFQVLPPLVTGTVTEQEEQLKTIGSLKARNIARMAVSISRIPGFIQLLERNYERFQNAQGISENDKKE